MEFIFETEVPLPFFIFFNQLCLDQYLLSMKFVWIKFHYKFEMAQIRLRDCLKISLIDLGNL